MGISLGAFRYALWLIAAGLLMAGLTLGSGRLHITGHEVDLVHSLDIAYRLADGAVPHRDYMSPLGVFAFLPVTFFLERGYGPGTAFLLGQAMVAALVLPGVWWIGASRLGGWLRVGFGVIMMIMATALVFGGETPALTLAMYYNRWAWVLTALVVVAILLPARAGWRAPVVDGAVMGAAGAALLMIKVTYVLALAPAVLVFLARERAWAVALGGAAAALGVLGAVHVAYGGLAFWTAYAGDLMAVATGPMRRYPGVALGDLLASPSALPMSLAGLAAIVLWRRAGLSAQGLYLLLLAPGFVYIVYQNWGNDPKWLLLLAVALIALRDRCAGTRLMRMDGRMAASGLAVLMLVLYFPSMTNMATSGMRNLAQSGEDFVPLLPGLERADIVVETGRKYQGRAERPYTAITMPDDIAADAAGAEDGEAEEETPVTFEVAGERFTECDLTGGFTGWMWTAADQLGAVEEAVGAHVYVADIYDFLWLFAPTQPTVGAGPWYYADDGVLDGVTHLLVPRCAVSAMARREKLADIAEAGWRLAEVIRTDLFILYRREGP